MLTIDPQRLRALTDERLAAVEAEKRAAEERERAWEAQRVAEGEKRAAAVIEAIPGLCEKAAREGKREAQVMDMTDSEFVGPHRDHASGFQESWFAYGALPVFKAIRDAGLSMKITKWDDPRSGWVGYYLIVTW